jgi:hypothetical protein
MSILEEVAAYVKDDVDKDELAGALKGYVKPEALTRDDLTGLIRQNKDFASLFDSEVNTRRDKGVDNFMEKKLPEILKEKEEEIRKKYNPEETPEQKRIRDLEQKIADNEKMQLTNLVKDQLSLVAKDKEFDSEIARKLAPLGDQAESLIDEILAWKNGILGETLKGQYVTKPPKTGGSISGLSTLTDSELYAAARDYPNQKAEVLAEIGRRTRPK